MLLSLKIALLVLVFDPWAFNAYSQPKTLVSQSLAVVLAVCLALLVRRHGWAILGRSALHVAVAALVAAYVLASLFALDHRVAIFGAPDRNLGLLNLLDNVLLYVAVVTLFRTRSDLTWLGASLVITSAILVGYAAIQRLGLDPIRTVSGLSEFRASGTTGNAGVLGQFAGTMVVAAAALALYARGRVRAVSGLVGALALAILWLAAARAAAIGLLAGTGLIVARQVVDTFSRARRLAVLVTIAAATVALAAAVSLVLVVGTPDVLTGSPGRIGSLLASAGGSVSGRLDIYSAALAEVRARPLLGVGPDNFVVAYPTFRPVQTGALHESEAPQSSTHSWFWKLSTDAGLLGLGAFLGCVLIGGVLAVRARTAWAFSALAGMVSFLATGLFSISHVATDWMPWVALGIIAAPITDTVHEVLPQRRGRAFRRSARRGLGLSASALVVGAGVLVMLFTVREPIVAAHHAQDARRAAAAGEPGNARLLRSAQQAVGIDRDRAEYWNLLGIGQLRTADYREAAGSFSQAARLAPHDFIYQTNLARAELASGLRGDRAALASALGTARQAAVLDPHVREVQYVLALAAAANGEDQEAVSAGERWLELGRTPGVTPDELIVESVATAYLRLDRPSDVARWVRLNVAADRADKPKLRLLLARALAAQGSVPDALAQLQMVLEADPGNAAALRLRGELTR